MSAGESPVFDTAHTGIGWGLIFIIFERNPHVINAASNERSIVSALRSFFVEFSPTVEPVCAESKTGREASLKIQALLGRSRFICLRKVCFLRDSLCFSPCYAGRGDRRGAPGNAEENTGKHSTHPPCSSPWASLDLLLLAVCAFRIVRSRFFTWLVCGIGRFRRRRQGGKPGSLTFKCPSVLCDPEDPETRQLPSSGPPIPPPFTSQWRLVLPQGAKLRRAVCLRGNLEIDHFLLGRYGFIY